MSVTKRHNTRKPILKNVRVSKTKYGRIEVMKEENVWGGGREVGGLNTRDKS